MSEWLATVLLMYVSGLVTGWIVSKITKEDDNV
jgi:hypothetical protein